MPRKLGIPAYRLKRARGRQLAYVTLPDRQTGQRQDVPLGDYGTPESREAYAKVIADWERRNGRVDVPERPQKRPAGGITIVELTVKYKRARMHVVSPGDQRSMTCALRLLNQSCGWTPARAFGPNMLRDVREAMIRGNPDADPPRARWSRRYTQRQVRQIVAMFRWASSHELLPPTIHQALRDVEPLRRGRTDARDPDPVGCAPEAAIDAVLELANDQIRGLIKLQLATGMRPGEACAIRPCDIDRSGKVWTYRPESHKTAHLGKRRVIYLGPRAKEIIRPFLAGRAPATPLFSPAEAEADRQAKRREARETPPGQGNEPGTHRVENPKRTPGAQYSSESYCRAVHKLCDRADDEAIAAATEAGQKIPAGMRLVARWHPHQLRHNAATEIRQRHGLEAAQLMLGHSSALVTEAVYAERDDAALKRIAAKIG